jgi:hypothetical protein
MKTPEQIEKLADEKYLEKVEDINNSTIRGFIVSAVKGGFVEGYQQCQEDMADNWLTMKEGDITVNFKPIPEFDEPAYPTRLDQLREQGWLEIDKAFSKYWTEYTDGDFSHFTAVEKAQRKIGWLKENYNPPTKKQD